MATFNPETATLEELRKAAEEEAKKASTKTAEEVAAEEAEQQRLADEQQAEEDRLAAEEEAKKRGGFVSERTIDLGDGAGVQVFKGKGASREEALEDLSDKLADAQRNATKLIREQAKKLVVDPTPKAEDEAILSEQLLKTPTEAFKRLFREVTGVPIEEFKTTHQKEKAFLAAQEKRSAADQFVAGNPDFADTPRNGKLINKWCELHNDFSIDGLNKAYQDLNESGLLDVKGEEASDEQKKADAEAQRIAEAAKAASSQRTRKASGISTQRRAPVVTPAGPTEEEMYSMPLDKLRELANKQLAAKHS